MANEQISLPYFMAILVVSGLVIRYLFFGGGQAPQRPARTPEALMRSREHAVERIQQMFPQVDRRSILWDLQRNGGNVQHTTERILSGRLDTPPVTFQPPPPPSRTPAANGSGAAAATRQPEKPTQPDLITRYNLKDKLDHEESGQTQQGSEAASGGDDKKGKGWSSNREERHASLQRRREEMILAARRKMEAKIAADKAVRGE